MSVSSFPDPARETVPLRAEWYALYTRSRFEKKLLYELTMRQVEVFLPMREIVSRWKDRRKKIWVPLFPGYVFVNHIDTPENRYRVLNIQGAVRFVDVCDRPIPVPEEQINAIRRFLETSLSADPYPYIQVGAQVEVISGPLSGIRGMLVEKRGKYRFVLQIDLIRQAISVEVDASDIQAIAASQRPVVSG
ncbi:MAG: UpxY family transcription antiterminator [Acidobacteriota bacterium]|nr:UpxY family transcription antiterminator [Acidobacteriota bacterium]